MPSQQPPPLDTPLEIIGKESNAKELNWDDDGVLDSNIDIDLF